ERDAGSIMLFGSARHTAELNRWRALGLNTFLTKPLRQSQVRDAIRAALGSRAAERAAAVQSRPSASETRRRLVVLLAEDNPVNQKVASALLEREGHRVVIAQDGGEALERSASDGFDLIVMDVQMPVLSGLEATKLIRAREQGTETH